MLTLFNKKKSIKLIAYRYSTIIYWTKLPWVSHILKKSDFHLPNSVFPTFAMKFQRRHWLEDFAWRVERVTQKFRLSRCLFLLCMSLLCGFMSIADVIRIFHFRKTMRYISLFVLWPMFKFCMLYCTAKMYN
jgi:hypothetical protein